METLEDVLALYEGNVFDGLRALGGTEEQVEVAVRRTLDALRVGLLAQRPFPLIPQLVGELAEVRRLVVVTSNSADVVEQFLHRHGIEGIAEVAGAEAGWSKVAKIEALIAAAPGQERYWYVGDTAGDMREARLAGATPVGVAWGWHEPELLLEAGAESIAETPLDLLHVVAPEVVPDFLGLG